MDRFEIAWIYWTDLTLVAVIAGCSSLFAGAAIALRLRMRAAVVTHFIEMSREIGDNSARLYSRNGTRLLCITNVSSAV
jgi:hypothetical protein